MNEHLDEHLDEQMNEKLSIISQPNLRKRLKRELIDLVINKNIELHFIDINLNDDSIEDSNGYDKGYYFYKLNVYTISNFYRFYIPPSYPFAPPKLNINYKPYMSLLRHNNYTDNLYKYKKIRCFCCETVLCGNNWNPVITIGKIIDEFNAFKKYSKEISHRIIVDVIKRKYLVEDLNLIDWLY